MALQVIMFKRKIEEEIGPVRKLKYALQCMIGLKKSFVDR